MQKTSGFVLPYELTIDLVVNESVEDMLTRIFQDRTFLRYGTSLSDLLLFPNQNPAGEEYYLLTQTFLYEGGRHFPNLEELAVALSPAERKDPQRREKLIVNNFLTNLIVQLNELSAQSCEEAGDADTAVFFREYGVQWGLCFPGSNPGVPFATQVSEYEELILPDLYALESTEVA